jgi:hypothetical protein
MKTAIRILVLVLVAAATSAAGSAPAHPAFSGVSLTVQSPVGPYETCISIADPIGGSGPFEYEWFINGISVGAGDYPGNLYHTNNGNSHWVGVQITETSSNITHSASAYATVQSGNAYCLM